MSQSAYGHCDLKPNGVILLSSLVSTSLVDLVTYMGCTSSSVVRITRLIGKNVSSGIKWAWVPILLLLLSSGSFRQVIYLLLTSIPK